MQKKTESEETVVFFMTFLSLVAFQLGGRGPSPLGPPLATPMKIQFTIGLHRQFTHYIAQSRKIHGRYPKIIYQVYHQ